MTHRIRAVLSFRFVHSVLILYIFLRYAQFCCRFMDYAEANSFCELCDILRCILLGSRVGPDNIFGIFNLV
jgi:hypothetical protein